MLVLGHSAGGGVTDPALLAATRGRPLGRRVDGARRAALPGGREQAAVAARPGGRGLAGGPRPPRVGAAARDRGPVVRRPGGLPHRRRGRQRRRGVPGVPAAPAVRRQPPEPAARARRRARCPPWSCRATGIPTAGRPRRRAARRRAAGGPRPAPSLPAVTSQVAGWLDDAPQPLRRANIRLLCACRPRELPEQRVVGRPGGRVGREDPVDGHEVGAAGRPSRPRAPARRTARSRAGPPPAARRPAPGCGRRRRPRPGTTGPSGRRRRAPGSGRSGCRRTCSAPPSSQRRLSATPSSTARGEVGAGAVERDVVEAAARAPVVDRAALPGQPRREEHPVGTRRRRRRQRLDLGVRRLGRDGGPEPLEGPAGVVLVVGRARYWPVAETRDRRHLPDHVGLLRRAPGS